MDIMLADGKIIVVVIGLVIILIGIFAFLFFTERKLNKLEKLVKEKIEGNTDRT